ncbi:hypothetical protein CAEBREN_16147 [Caenorhabditis brenneri]|uniref:Uncharacterized protein n=1 Tax=Caenorhabditis brenneri TaxID=135651 RepID=G0NBR2_CAEBE|nr:hypothetical protein CAEBREN_16147 [Caenorhabditis brenneri]
MQPKTMDLKAKAYKLLRSHDVKDLVWSFSPKSIVEAEKRKLVITAKLEDLKTDRMDGNGVSRFTLCTLGQLFSRIMYMLQEKWEETDKDHLVQNHMSYTHLGDPSPGADIIFVATFLPGQNGTDFLHFCIEADSKQKRTIIGNGSSSIAIIRPTVVASTQTEGDASEEKSPRDDSSRSGPSLPAAQATSSSSAPPSAPTNAELREQPAVAVGNPESAKKSILRRPAVVGVPAAKQRRVVFVEEKETKSFMLVGVSSRHPKSNDELEKMLKAIVKAENVEFESLPIKKRRSFVLRFSVKTSQECRKVERLIEQQRWHEFFSVVYLCSDAAEPFFWNSMPMTTIIETMFLAQRMVRNPQEDHSLDAQLKNKRFLALSIEDAALKEEVLSGLNDRGKSLFKKDVQPQASKRGLMFGFPLKSGRKDRTNSQAHSLHRFSWKRMSWTRQLATPVRYSLVLSLSLYWKCLGERVDRRE